MRERKLAGHSLRTAARSDVTALRALMELSVRALHGAYYADEQIERALADVYEIDTLLIDDGTYYVVEDGSTIAACGGWSRHAKLCAGESFGSLSDDLLDPAVDAAKIRAFFVRPSHARRGLASLLLERCEAEAVAAGFRRAELGATLAGVPFYAARGYTAIGRADIELSGNEPLAVVHMERTLLVLHLRYKQWR